MLFNNFNFSKSSSRTIFAISFLVSSNEKLLKISKSSLLFKLESSAIFFPLINTWSLSFWSLVPLHFGQTSPFLVTPVPLQVLQAPRFELNEKSSGSNFKEEYPQIGQAIFLLNTFSSCFEFKIISLLSPKDNACSTRSLIISIGTFLGINSPIT